MAKQAASRLAGRPAGWLAGRPARPALQEQPPPPPPPPPTNGFGRAKIWAGRKELEGELGANT